MAEENQSTNPSQEQPVESTPTLPLPRTYEELLGRNQNTSTKREWPEVVGLTAEEAEKKIKEDKPGVHVHVVPSNCFITMDFRQDRVRLFVDHSRKVEKPPRIG
ncbi:hypothetical protein LWI28_020030 [Acer negundo]|uniref:Subtilisin inhibitor 1 n=1 Tax=Acer negundo TaxID=4023 RepID=A0AAD5NF91_ACENE|nr:hypothetical protein LWI28_020030 [Acer negundo]KAK4834339.1 hypothetical protein QYF36_020999 [Acer negundo]